MTGPGTPRPYRRVVWGAALAAVALALLAAFLLLDTAPPAEWQDRKVTVPKGSRLPEVVSALHEGGVLRRPLVFRALVYLTFTSRRLHYGEYTFFRPPSTFEVWQKVFRGDVVTYKVTVFVTGLGTPNQMREYVKNGAAPQFALWNPGGLGYLAVYAMHALATGEIKAEAGQKFTAGKLGEYTIEDDPDLGLNVLLGPPFVYNKDNIDQFNW